MSSTMKQDPRETGGSRAEQRTPVQDESIGGLLRQLGREIPSLVTKELALLKAEAKESVRTTKEGVAAVSTGGAVMMAGLIMVLLAAVYALGNIIQPWAAALLVGVVAMVVGFMMVKAGQKKFQNDLKPQHTLNTLQKDRNAIGGRMS